MPKLSIKSSIGAYYVLFLISDGEQVEIYRVKGKDGRNYCLRLYDCAKLNHSHFDEYGKIREITFYQTLSNEHICHYVESSRILIEGRTFEYVILEYVNGETLIQYLSRKGRLTVHESIKFAFEILETLNYLHRQTNPIIHNGLSAQNIMLDFSSDNPSIKFINFTNSLFLSDCRKNLISEGLDYQNCAPELINGVYSVRSDLYSVGVLLYFMIFGEHPFYQDSSKFANTQGYLNTIEVHKRKTLLFPNQSIFELDKQLVNVIKKSLSPNVDERFGSASEFIGAINGDIVLPESGQAPISHTEVCKCISGRGFSAVVGMSSIKEKLRFDVIDILANPDDAKEWGLSIPNGILFYGPPGCGKTYFAEKFAEETGYHFISVKCSNIAVPFIHGGQGKIAELFEDARTHAPSILFLDEIDALIPKRSNETNTSMMGEVNEFLTQLNNCGESGVLVIAATNFPSNIDKAALRAGRIEFKYYIPLPDEETRALMYKMYLDKTKADFGIDYDALSFESNHFVSSQIKQVVAESARLSRRRGDKCITMSTLLEIIKDTKPNFTENEIMEYERIRSEFEQT